MTPTHYVEKEGEIWREWEGPGVDAFLLEERRQRMAKDQGDVWICGIRVHALRFRNGRVWDCVNGWRRD